MKLRITLTIIILAIATNMPSAIAQDYNMNWWSIPYGNQRTCGIDDGLAFEQIHFYEWSGEKPQHIYIYITGPHTYDFDEGIFVSHYKVTDVFPHTWRWETDYEDYRQHWIHGELNDEFWNDATNRTDTPIGYEIELFPLMDGIYAADHHMAAHYGFEPVPQENAGVSVYNASDCTWFPVYLPTILK